MDKIKIGDIVFGKVTGIEKYGIFLSLDDNINGLIHISEISNSFVKNVNDYANIGETIKAKVIAIDHNYEKLKLSIKELQGTSNGRKNSIIETNSGFNELEKQLDIWIESKEKELNEKN